MKKFRFAYSYIVIALLVAVCLIFCYSVFINVRDAVNFWGISAARTVFSLSLATLSATLAIFSAAMLFYGRYIVKGKILYLKFGFFGSKIKISDISALTKYPAQKKLVMFFKDGKYSVAVIFEKDEDAFAAALKEIDPAIIYRKEEKDGE